MISAIKVNEKGKEKFDEHKKSHQIMTAGV